MATYQELYNLNGDVEAAVLRQKIMVGIAIKANAIAKLAAPTATQVAWAKAALSDPAQYLPIVFNYILADYNAISIVSITTATDAQVQTAVNAAVDTLLGV